MDKLLIIVGPTATGKTSLGLHVAQKCSAELVSADSRQVYKGMDIGTGKDIPSNLKSQISNLKFRGRRISFYGNSTKIWGYDLVEPDDEFSVAHFRQIARAVIHDIWKRKKLPIVVGGTGLYVKVLTQPMARIHIPPNKKLRRKLETQSIQALQNRLKKLNPSHFRQMNQSDRKNPRRLVRAIEISMYQKTHLTKSHGSQKPSLSEASTLWIGLKAPRQALYKRIDERVDERLRLGAQDEVRTLLKKGYGFNLPAMSAMGYIQWKPYVEGKTSRQRVIRRWKLDEHAYARRQLTWFKKNQKISWYDITEPGFTKNVVRTVLQWYSEP
ncbi:tRNA (adenosine(37)-N6)-dimethylallyltransferase MiaA [Patescibacteria group bacterium]|nr:tRNA (adenosine(37)-N6)-dimethylallyltransferase MiaA [Patescibacteria group bacterium]